VFELGVADIGHDDALDDLGLDSLMAMEFRLRVNAMFAIDLPLLELLRGVSVNSLATRILAGLHLTDAGPAAVTEQIPETDTADDDVDLFIEQLSETELREVLAELEKQGGAHS
jgi:acyl carrier protein